MALRRALVIYESARFARRTSARLKTQLNEKRGQIKPREKAVHAKPLVDRLFFVRRFSLFEIRVSLRLEIALFYNYLRFHRLSQKTLYFLPLKTPFSWLICAGVIFFCKNFPQNSLSKCAFFSN